MGIISTLSDAGQVLLISLYKVVNSGLACKYVELDSFSKQINTGVGSDTNFTHFGVQPTSNKKVSLVLTIINITTHKFNFCKYLFS